MKTDEKSGEVGGQVDAVVKPSTAKVILNTSPEAAQFVENISGWVSRTGLFFGKDERAARYAGCTHVACEDCGEPTDKGRTVCDECREKRLAARYEVRERAVWDEKGMLYSEVADRFFQSWDEVADYMEEENERTLDPVSLRLVICEPVYLSPVDEDRWSDDLPEDGELPDEVARALEELNEALRAAGPVSWMPGKKAAMVSL